MPGTGGSAPILHHEFVPTRSQLDQCWGPGKTLSLILCLRAELLTLGVEGGGGGQASQIGAGGFGQGLAAEQDTLRREDVRHLLAPSHNQAGGRPLTPGSSVSSASMTDTCRLAPYPMGRK